MTNELKLTKKSIDEITMLARQICADNFSITAERHIFIEGKRDDWHIMKVTKAGIIASMELIERTPCLETTPPKEIKKGDNCWLYRDYTISPSYSLGYEFFHKDYDGPEDFRCGHEKTLEEVLASIDEQILESEKPNE